MADRNRWDDRGDRDTAWRGEDRYASDRDAQRYYHRDAAGYRDVDGRVFGPGGYEGERRGEVGRDDYERDRRGAWPEYDPDRNGPANRAQSSAYWRGEAGPSGRGADWREAPDQNRPLWGGREERNAQDRGFWGARESREDRTPWLGEEPGRRDAREPRESREVEGRSFWDRAREEAANLFGASRPGEHRGRGPRGYRRSDQRIHEDVNDRLTEDPYVDASDVHVRVDNGEVTLEGHVRSRQDKRRAEDLADRVSGVCHVQNNLRTDEWRASDRDRELDERRRERPDGEGGWTNAPPYPLP